MEGVGVRDSVSHTYWGLDATALELRIKLLLVCQHVLPELPFLKLSLIFHKVDPNSLLFSRDVNLLSS